LQFAEVSEEEVARVSTTPSNEDRQPTPISPTINEQADHEKIKLEPFEEDHAMPEVSADEAASLNPGRDKFYLSHIFVPRTASAYFSSKVHYYYFS